MIGMKTTIQHLVTVLLGMMTVIIILVSYRVAVHGITKQGIVVQLVARGTVALLVTAL
ncbi:hypothetical protein NIES3974_03130 [Calothrix sp. NIES-3974]|nr:hypothetical protein NIES3974_03130 [Calothrix sp. NIES-3974]